MIDFNDLSYDFVFQRPSSVLAGVIYESFPSQGVAESSTSPDINTRQNSQMGPSDRQKQSGVNEIAYASKQQLMGSNL